MTYSAVLTEVCQLATWMINNGIKKGDRVIIYMPMIPQGIISMLACARIGAIHSVVFGGFAANELENRIEDAEPKLIITASCGVEPRKTIHYLPIVQEAINDRKILVLLYQRENVYKETKITNTTFIYNDEVLKISEPYAPIEWVESTHPLYILYTSGTTGAPKGICRDQGGTAVAANYSCKIGLDLNQGDVSFSTSDIGWVVGHTYITYGITLRGACSVIFEGKPVGTPDSEVYWRIIEKHNCKTFYCSPTAFRAIKKVDHECEKVKQYKMLSLKSIHMAGERCDPDTIHWLQEGFRKEVIISDSWWQTESGWHISANNCGICPFPVKAGSATKPMPGFDVRIVCEETSTELEGANQEGKVMIRLPMPPSFMLTLWNNDEAFLNKYISEDSKYYMTGDNGFFDEDGYLHIMARTDDMIKVAAHRLSTGRIEEVIAYSKFVVESAVVGKFDELKGEVPFAFIVVKPTVTSKEEHEKVKEDVQRLIVEKIGAIARIGGAIIVNRLPKTRSGKCLRLVLRSILNGDSYKVPPTIEDIGAVEEIIEELKNEKII